MVSYCHDTREEGRAKTLLSSPFPMRTDPKGGRISSKASGRPASSSSFHHASPHVRPWSRCRPDLYPFLQTFAAAWPGLRPSCSHHPCWRLPEPTSHHESRDGTGPGSACGSQAGEAAGGEGVCEKV